MAFYHHFSLRRKLIAINMLTAVIILLLTSFSLLLVETIKSKNLALDKLSSIGSIVSLHSGAALSFNDKKTAAETLATLSSEPSILYACLCDVQEKLFVSYTRTSHSGANIIPIRSAENMHILNELETKEKAIINKDGLHLLLPVTVSQEEVGSLYIHAGLDLFFDRLHTYLILVLVISVFALVVAFLLSARLQKTISIPIEKLTEIMAKVSKNKQYNLQVEHESCNEIGYLYQGFNEMLYEIDKRDRDLRLTQYSMDYSSDGICWIDEDGKITNASLGACKLLKYNRNDLSEATVFQVWEGLGQEGWKRFWKQIDASQDIHFSATMLTRFGDKIPVEGSSHTVHLQQNLCCMLFRDVSERKKLELQLQRSQKLEALGTLVGGVAHDLNNILSALTSYPELLLLDLPEDSKLRIPLQTIERSGIKAAAIVQDMLTLSRRSNIVKKNIDLNNSVLEYLQSPEHKNLLEFHPDVRIHAELTEEVGLIFASSIHMAKCIMNLVSNGTEAMPAGGELIIRTENIVLEHNLPGYSTIKKGKYVLLQIIDMGVGISAEDLQQIYDPFYSKKKLGRSGTGLGMTIVWNSVADHDGYITVESAEGAGTSFSLYFPSRNSVEIDQETVTRIEDCMGDETVLIIDDVLEQRIVASAMLTKLGYSVSVAASGHEAVELLRVQEVDILVLDMIMPPGMDGLDTFRKILEIHPEQKVVIASGFAETKRVKELQRLGGGNFVKKPYNLKELGVAIRQELERLP